jgi:PAS domain S-box-containing protein
MENPIMSIASPPENPAKMSECPVRDELLPLHLLLVEDNPSDVLFLRKMLESRCPGHYEMTLAGSFGDAKMLLNKQSFQAVLLDLSLPDSQGLETIGKVAAFAPQLPIVVLSGIADATIVPEAVRTGAQDYLLKGQCDGATIARAIQYAIDRKQIEEQLRAQQRELEKKNQELEETKRHLEIYRDRYVNLYDFAPLGYVTLDEEGYVQEINLAGANLLHTDRKAITGYPFSDYVVKEDLAVFTALLRKCVDDHAEVRGELRLKAEGDRSIPVQLRSVPVESPEEGVVFCKTAITDITELKKMEEATRHSCNFLQTVIDAIPDPIMVIQRDYHIILANRAARELSGKIDIASQCLPCFQVSHHRDSPCVDESHPCPLEETIRTKAPMTVMHKHFDAHGCDVFVEVTAAPVFDEKGEVTHVIEACRDITDRKRAEEALAQDRNLLRTLIDYLPDCIYIKDREGRFLTANLATAHLMGVATPEELLGKTDWDFYPPDVAAQYQADEEELLRSGQPLVNKDEPHRDAAGGPLEILTTKVPLKDGEGKVVGLVGITRGRTS